MLKVGDVISLKDYRSPIYKSVAPLRYGDVFFFRKNSVGIVIDIGEFHFGNEYAKVINICGKTGWVKSCELNKIE